jgi:hypothetical protein
VVEAVAFKSETNPQQKTKVGRSRKSGVWGQGNSFFRNGKYVLTNTTYRLAFWLYSENRLFEEISAVEILVQIPT